MAIEPVTHLEKTIAGTVEPVTHLEKVISEYGGGGGGGGGGSVTVDAELSASSENPVQNKVINAAISSIRQLPAVSASDNGKFLRVVSGAWAAATVPSAETASF